MIEHTFHSLERFFLTSLRVIQAKGHIGTSILTALVESKKFTVSVLTRETYSPTVPEIVRMHKVNYSSHAQLVAALKGQDAIVNALGGHGVLEVYVGFDWKSKTVTLFDDGTPKYNASNVNTVGQAVVGALSNPEYSKNKLLRVHDFYISHRDVLAIVEERLGRFEEIHLDSGKVEKENWERLFKGEK